MKNENENLIEHALIKALELHQGQIRKGDGCTPYIVHAIEVGMIVGRYTHSQELVAAAILHDVVEDCKYSLEKIEQEFGSEVRTLVDVLTENKLITDWADRKIENLERLKQNQDAYFIKSADTFANMRSLLAALKREGSVVWKRFNAPKDRKMEYFKVILQHTEEFLPKKLIEEYVSVLKDLEYSEAFEKGNPGFAADAEE